MPRGVYARKGKKQPPPRPRAGPILLLRKAKQSTDMEVVKALIVLAIAELSS